MRPTMLRAVLFGALALPILAMGQAAKPAQQLNVVGAPVIKVDTLCNSGTGTTSITIRNDGPATKLDLTSDDITTKSSDKTLQGAKLSLTPKEPQNVGGKQEWEVAVTVTGVNDEGNYETTLRNQGVAIGTLKIQRPAAPFSVSLDVATPDSPELTFVDGQPAHFWLKNGDPQEVPITWEYSVNGQVLRSTDAEAVYRDHKRCFWDWWCKEEPKGNAVVQAVAGPVTLPRNGEREIIFAMPHRWFTGWFTGLFKGKDADGHLTVEQFVADCAGKTPVVKTFKIKSHFIKQSSISRQIMADVIIFLFLLIGGSFSLWLGSALPNQMRRIKLKGQLSVLGAQIGNLSYSLASRLRVLLGMEHQLIKERLKNLTWSNPDFSTEMDDIELAVGRLRTRSQYIAALGEVRTKFETARAKGLPPGMLFDLEEKFEKIVAIGRKSNAADTDAQTAQDLIKGIQDEIDDGVQVTANSLKPLVLRFNDFKKGLDRRKKGLLVRTKTYLKIRHKLPGPFRDLEDLDPGTIKADDMSPAEFIFLDELRFKLEMLDTYVRLAEGIAEDHASRKELEKHEDKLVDFLSKNSWSAEYDAQLLVREMKDGNFKKDIEEEITNSRVRIKYDPQTVRQFQPVEFSLCFLKTPLNERLAREEWTCSWTFKGEGDETFVEEGFSVTHYFRQTGPYHIEVELDHHRDHTQLKVPKVGRLVDGRIHVAAIPQGTRRHVWSLLLQRKWADARREWRSIPRNARRRLERIRLALALFVALAALQAGAKEKLLQMEVWPALLAIIALGFGADQVKNLLTQRPTVPDKSTPR
jgi:hypothetical protein